MTIRMITALIGVFATTWQGAPPPAPATVEVRYAESGRDNPSNGGSVTLTVKAGEVRSAIVWESECTLGARANAVAAAPGVDQYWTFRTELAASADGRPGIRVKYQRTRIAAAGPQPPEKEHWLPLDGTTELTVTETSWRKDCKYGGFTMVVVAKAPENQRWNMPDRTAVGMASAALVR
ncbi:MAG: hypothetical protein IPL75_01330 [Acidobacteria bacterium]|nr:hypothetical protein [Acidobacteriota bacterium]